MWFKGGLSRPLASRLLLLDALRRYFDFGCLPEDRLGALRRVFDLGQFPENRPGALRRVLDFGHLPEGRLIVEVEPLWRSSCAFIPISEIVIFLPILILLFFFTFNARSSPLSHHKMIIGSSFMDLSSFGYSLIYSKIPFNKFIQMGWSWCLAQLTLPITFIQAGTDLGSQQFSFSF